MNSMGDVVVTGMDVDTWTNNERETRNKMDGLANGSGLQNFRIMRGMTSEENIEGMEEENEDGGGGGGGVEGQ
jgi:hypothetical protein